MDKRIEEITQRVEKCDLKEIIFSVEELQHLLNKVKSLETTINDAYNKVLDEPVMDYHMEYYFGDDFYWDGELSKWLIK